MKSSIGWNGRSLRLLMVVCVLFCLGTMTVRRAPVRAAVSIQNSVAVTTVSAASYVGGQSSLAPGSIVAAFGTQLATGTLVASSQPLPTSLLNTTVTVNGIPAQLFFVSAGQINYLLPAGLPDGDSEVVVKAIQTNGDEIISRGTVRIAPTAPSIFTADASGTGAPAGLTGRINQSSQFVFDSTLPFSSDPINPGRLIPAPIDVGTTEYPAFLILYGTGIRNATSGSVRVVIGGVESSVEYSGPAPGFTGLDQINVRLPVSLKGSGLVELTAVVNGVSSNAITLNLAGTSGSTLSISGFSVSAPVVAGETISIDGNGFSAVTSENVVRFGGAQARVIAASASQLTVIVPFGAESGQVVIQSKGVEARSGTAFRIKTSISGIVQSTGTSTASPAPLNEVTVRLSGTNISVRTNPQGTFVLSDIPDGVSLIEIDGGTNVTTPPYPSVTLKMTARADRDNQVAQPISLQQITGGSGNVGTASSGESGSALTAILSGLNGLDGLNGFNSLVGAGRNEQETRLLQASVREQLSPQAGSTQISDRGVTLDVPVTTVVKFPDGRSTGTLQVTVIEKSRLPGIVLPTGVYSSMIAQITPIGASFSPGASITFPNPDPTGLAAGSRVDLYRYDSTAGSFVKRGTATVSANRQQVVSDTRVVDAGGFWLAAVASSVTTVTGRVIDSNGNPVAGGKVTVNGRAAISDQNGGFSLPDVATTGGAAIQVEAVVPQQFGTPPRGISSQTQSVKGGITNVGLIALSSTNQPGLVMWPLALDLTAGSKATTISITLTQPAPTRGLVINLLSVNPAVASVPVSVTIPAGKTTASFTATPTGTGNSLIEAITLLNGSSIDGAAAVSVSQPGPTLTGISPTSAAEGALVTITGTGFSNVALHHYVSFYRNGRLLTYLPPSEIRVVKDSSNRSALQIRVPRVGPGAVTVDVAVVDTKTGVLSDPSAPIGLTILQKTIPIPKLSGLTPSQGPPRSLVTINGTGFNPNPKLNSVRFVPGEQGLPAVEAEISQAAPSQLVITVPSTGIPSGKATIIARVLDEMGLESGDSNALSFNVTTTRIEPPGKPLLSKIYNRSTGDPSGKEGDLIVATGSGFGLSYFDSDKEAFVGGDKLISVFRYYQNNRIANITFPTAASGGTTLITTVPSGLQKGAVQVTVTNYDLETDTPGPESQFLNFMTTEGTPLRLREAEPNDTIGQASEIIFPSILEGDIAKGETGEIIHRYPNGDLLPLADLYRISLTQRISGVIELTWMPGSDLDLILLRKNTQGVFEPVTIIGKRSGESESITGTLIAGEYLVGIGAYSGRSVYNLSLQTTTGAPNGQ